MKYEATIGLEIHCSVNTNTKMFSPATNGYNEMPNTYVNEIDLAFPGTLPLPNMEAIRKALKMAKALNCSIPKYFIFDRKNYYYPDLPKGYQITQNDYPVGIDGNVSIYVGKEIKEIKIHDIHLEEDTASLDHFGDVSLIDYNRCGVPLLETVTEPCIHSGDEALAFLDALKKIFHYCNVSLARTELGQMRCDVNISLAEKGKPLGTKVEVKNVGSFFNVKEAIEYEIKRQNEILENGGNLIQETRRFDEKTKTTIHMRNKIEAVDYKYFRECNIPPLEITSSLLDEIEIPVLQFDRLKKYYEEYNLKELDATTIVKDMYIADYFEKLITLEVDPTSAANWMTGNVLSTLNKENIKITEFNVTPENLAKLIKLINDNVISSKQGKQVFEKMLTDEIDPADIVKKLGMTQITDEEILKPMIISLIENNMETVMEYKKGRSVFNFFIGEIMKQTKGKANPAVVAKIFKEEVEKR
ncbi:MAG: Asp-tRNA(Asn)/Glu-tRNA(Gln) amidotransferase subunit GatB [Bacilli bacterium]